MSLISIITVVLNDEPGLRATANSLSSQEFTDFEWLVKDGGSTDGTAKSFPSLTPLPAWLESSPDAGIYDAMNTATAHATGDWLLFLNAGDVLSESTTLSQVATILRSIRADWAFGTVRNLDASGRAVGWQSASPFNPLGLAIGQTTVPHQACFIRRELFESLGGYRTDFGTEADQEFLYRASLRGTPEEIVWPIADFRIGGRGMQRPTGHFARAMRRARREQGRPLLGNRLTDEAATAALLAKEYLKAAEARFIGRVSRS